ncbi:MAG: hypothetical protein IJS63_06725 [Bacteroidaceae bacterium]|nr:hypothetical protein [Bacteroidaceae bacterium]
MKKIKLLLAAMAAMVTMGTQAQTWTGSAVGAGTFYLYNVGSGQWLCAANDWGTYASLTSVGGLDVAIAQVSENVYTIDTQISNGGDSHFLLKNNDNFPYTDGGAYNWTFIETSSGSKTYYLQTATEGEYLAYDGSTTKLTFSTTQNENAQWKLVTRTDRIAALANASESNPVDATFLIEDANFGRNDNRVSSWSMDAGNQNLSGGNNNNNCAESYHSTFTLTQTLSGIPNGTYKMTAQGFYQQDGTDNDNLPKFYIGESTATFPIKSGSEGSMSDASVSFTNGNYTIEPITVTVTNGSVTLGAKLETNTGLWCIWDNFQLTCISYDGCEYDFRNIPSVDYTTSGSAPAGGSTYALYNETGKFLYNDGVTPRVSSTNFTLYTLETTGDEYYIRSNAGLLYKQSNSGWNTWTDGGYGDYSKWTIAEVSGGKYRIKNHNLSNQYFAPNSDGEGIQCYSDKTNLTGWYFINVTNPDLAFSLLYALQQTKANTYDTFADSDEKEALGVAFDRIYLDYVCAANFTSTTYNEGVAAIQAAIDDYYASRFSSLTGSEGGEDITSWITNPTPTSNGNGWTFSVDGTFESGNNVGEFWNKSGASLSQTIELPIGYYRLTAVALTRTGFNAPLAATGATSGELASMNITTVGSGTVNSVSGANSWFNAGNGVNELDFYVPTTQNVTISLTADNITSDYWMVWRSFQLTAVGSAEENLLNLEKYLDNTALTRANALLNSYTHVTGTERTNLQSAVTALTDYADGESSVSANVATRKALKYAIVAPYNAMSPASVKAAYDEYYYENETATRLGADVSSVTAPTTAAEASTAAHAINIINYNFIENKGYEDVSATVLGSWTDNNVGSRSGEHYDGSGSGGSLYFEQSTGWSSATVWEMSRQQTVNLSAGKYVLKVAARASSGADARLSVTIGDGTPIITYAGHHGNTGLGITTAGEACYTSHADDETKVYANSNNGRGFEWRYIPFELDSDDSVTLSFYAVNTSGAQYQFVSFTSLGIWTDPAVAAKTDLLTAINNATDITTAAINVGTGVFQIPASAKTTLETATTTAQSVYDNSNATKDDVTSATSTLNDAITAYNNAELNAPAVGNKYYIKVATTGHAKLGNAWLMAAGSTSSSNPTGYTFSANKAPAAYLSQAFTFTQISGNSYKISIGDVYLTNGTANGSPVEWKASQIQGTTDESKAMAFTIAAADVDNTFYIYNTETNSTIACQSGGNIYTEAGNAYFSVEKVSQATVEVSVKAGKLATRIFPFKPTLPEGVVAYSCAENTGTSLRLVEVTEPAANVPYILYSEAGCSSTDLTGWGSATADTYTEGYLTGVFTRTEVPEGSYVLQTQSGTQAFYKVNQTGAYSSPYRVYVTVPSSDVKAFSFTLDDIETAIEAARAEGENTVTLRYNAAGQQMQNAQKGLNIIKMEDGSVRKVLVK